MKVERPIMWKWCTTLVLLLACTDMVMAQQGGIHLLVLDSLERTPIENVEVAWSIGAQRRTAVTDDEGHCSVDPGSDLPVLLELSRVGYVPRKVRANSRKDARTIEILLVPLELPGVEVTRPRPEVIFQRADLHAADLLINEAGIWVLAYEHPRMVRAEGEAGQEILRDVRLVLLDTNNQEIARCRVPEEVKGLRRDLHDQVVIEGTVRAYGAVHTADGLHLAPFGLEDLRKSVLPWTDSIPGWVLGSNSDRVMPAFDHIAFDPCDDSVRVVCTAVDTFMLSLFRSEYKYLKGPEKVVAMNLAQELGVDKEVIAGYMSGFQHNIWFKPLYAPLFVVGDTLLVFDHGRGRLRKFSRGFMECGQRPLPYLDKREGRDWAGRITQDRKTQELYAVFQRNGSLWLRRIDPVTGEMGRRTVATYRYPERVQVFGDALYYVYRPFESLQKRSIYRERL